MRLTHIPPLCGLLLLIGCGKAEVAESPQPTPEVESTSVAVSNEPTPVDIVSQFLDQIRRGGQDSGAGTLLGYGFSDRGVYGGVLRVFRKLLHGRPVRPRDTVTRPLGELPLVWSL